MALVISVLVHVGSGLRLSRAERPPRLIHGKQQEQQVKIRIVEQKPTAPSAESMPKILETPQAKTEKPDEASYVGNVDHKTQKETRLPDNLKRDRAKDPGQKGRPDAQENQAINPQLAEQPKPQASPKKNTIETAKGAGKVSFDSLSPKPRNSYEALLPTNIQDLPGQLNAGFQDYVDDKILEGDRIDINTTEYRYIGYFTNMRKAIELVWTYPSDAVRRGMQGEVGLEFAIAKDGRTSRIRVIKSSGYEPLDRAIVEAIKLASPFSPLPTGFRQERIVVTGSFRYVLTGLGAH